MTPESYQNGLNYYLGHAFPLALIFGLLFFLIGLLIGYILWKNYRVRAELAESENVRLRQEQTTLRQQIQEAGGSV